MTLLLRLMCLNGSSEINTNRVSVVVKGKQTVCYNALILILNTF